MRYFSCSFKIRFATPFFGLSLLLCLSFITSAVYSMEKFEPGLAPYELKINSNTVRHNVTFRSVLPGETLTFRLPQSEAIKLFQDQKEISFKGAEGAWTAPQNSGLVSLEFVRVKDGARIIAQVFIMQPANKLVNGKLNGYNIGSYPPPLKGQDAYKTPVGFIEVTPENSGVRISPHFTLGQFLCKQRGGYPKYIALRPRLLEKLEYLLAEVNNRGIATDSFVVMSGYRTPYYNHAIGNVANSRHIYGGAADIYIDVNPKDDVMDDLNGDGKQDALDAAFLFAIADDFVKQTGKNELRGGVGQYRSNAAHGPFVHVDVRGTHARWKN